jgi:hypothetical protein
MKFSWSAMQQLFSFAGGTLFILGGPLLVIFRRQIASYMVDKNRALYDQVPTLFPPPEADHDRLRLQVHEWLVAIIGLGWITVSIALVAESIR